MIPRVRASVINFTVAVVASGWVIVASVVVSIVVIDRAATAIASTVIPVVIATAMANVAVPPSYIASPGSEQDERVGLGMSPPRRRSIDFIVPGMVPISLIYNEEAGFGKMKSPQPLSGHGVPPFTPR